MTSGSRRCSTCRRRCPTPARRGSSSGSATRWSSCLRCRAAGRSCSLRATAPSTHCVRASRGGCRTRCSSRERRRVSGCSHASATSRVRAARDVDVLAGVVSRPVTVISSSTSCRSRRPATRSRARCEAVEASAATGSATSPCRRRCCSSGRFGRHPQPEDQGVVAILDPRLRTKPYGRAFLAALLAARSSTTRADVAAFFGAVLTRC